MKNTWLYFIFIICLIILLPGCTPAQNTDSINVYTRSDACGAAQTWAQYLGDYAQEDLLGTAVYGDPGLAEAVKRDPTGIGYNNIGYAYDMNTGKPVEGLMIVPLDQNENGRIDPDEDVYATKKMLIEAIAAGHYPSPPARDLNLVAHNEFKGISREFVRWTMTEGQRFVDEAGYIALPQEQIDEELLKAGENAIQPEMEGTITISGAWALYPMVVKWAEEFQKIYPDIEFDISAGGAGKGLADAVGEMVDLGMVSREIYPVEIEKGAVWVSVTKDAVVPVMNSNNPAAYEVLAQGLQKQTLIDIWITGQITNWYETVE
jgi:ABC-type phosphate transport system substrate-binding protein